MAEVKEKEISLSKDLEDILTKIEKMSVLDLANLVKALEQKFGVSAAPVAVAGAGVAAGGAAGGAAAAEEKKTFNVMMTSFGDNKIGAIKEVRAVTGLGLKEAKDFVDGLPKALKEGVSKEEADKIKAIIETAGGKVEIK